jgi:probable rRNA maturation factor
MIDINLFVDEDLWRQTLTIENWRALFAAVLQESAKILLIQYSFVIDVSLINAEAMKKINLDQRGINGATNVLSFPLYEQHELKNVPKLRTILLGDIVISYNDSVMESTLYCRPFLDHVVHLFVHGFLHLVGFDHVDSRESAKMEHFEQEILRFFGIENLYD